MELPQVGANIEVGGYRPVAPPSASQGISEAREAFAGVEREARSIMYWQDRMDQAQRLSAGDSDYIIGSAKTFESARGIADPNERTKFITNNLDALRTQIIKDNPSAAAKLTEQLGIRYADDIKEMTHQNMELADKNLKGNLAMTERKAVIAASSAKNDAESNAAIKTYKDTLDQNVGLLGQGVVDNMKNEFDYKLQVAHYGQLAAKDPQAALQMSLPDSHLEFKDWFNIRSEAHRELMRQENAGHDEWHAIQDKAMQGALAPEGDANRSSDAQVEADYNDGKLSDEVYESRFHHAPTSTAAADHYAAMIEGFSGSKEEFDWMFAQQIAGNPYLKDPDRRRLNSMKAAMDETLSSEEGKHAQELKLKARDELIKRHPSYFMSMTNPNAVHKAQMDNDINSFMNSIKHLSQDKQDEALRKFLDEDMVKHPPFVGPTRRSSTTPNTTVVPGM